MKEKLIKINKQEDYNTLKRWCETIYNFMLAIDYGYTPMVNNFRDIILKIDANHNITTMRRIYRETNIIVRDTMSAEKIHRLNLILTDSFNYNLTDEISNDLAIIKRIIKRGMIRNAHEYELVKQREEEIYADEAQNELADTLRNLMADYESSKNNK